MSQYSILRSSLAVTFLSIASSLLSFANQLIIAKSFGASLHMDAYFIAVSAPMLVAGVLTATFSYSMVPTLIQYKSDAIIYKKFAGLMLLSIGIFSLIVTLIGYFMSPIIVNAIWPTVPREIYAEALRMTQLSWITTGLMLLSSYLSAMLQASKRFVMPMMAAILPYLAMIYFIAIIGHSVGTVAIVWGMLVGQALTIPLLLYYTAVELNCNIESLTYWKHVIKYFTKVPLVMIAMLVFTVHQFVDAYWAPKLGNIYMSYLGYSQRLLIAMGGFVIVGPSAVLVPRITEAITQGRHNDFYTDCGRVVRTVLAFGAGLAVVISVLAVPVIELLFQRGAFNTEATKGLVSIMPIMMVGMTAMLGVVITFRALFAKHDVAIGAMLGLFTFVLYFILSGILSKILGITGIAIAYAVSWWILLITGLFALWRDKLDLLMSRENYRFIIQLIFTTLVTGLVTIFIKYLLIQPMNEIGFIALFVDLSVVVAISVLTFYVVSVTIFRMSDVQYVLDNMIGIMLRRTHRGGNIH